jgi:hypothetical protein
MRSGMESLGKRNPLTYEHFADFIKAYKANNRTKVTDERWKAYTREQIAEKGDSLDLGLNYSNGNGKNAKPKEPARLVKDAVKELTLITKEMTAIAKELRRYAR